MKTESVIKLICIFYIISIYLDKIYLKMVGLRLQIYVLETDILFRVTFVENLK